MKPTEFFVIASVRALRMRRTNLLIQFDFIIQSILAWPNVILIFDQTRRMAHR